MNKVSMCFILNDDYVGTLYSLDRIGLNFIENEDRLFIPVVNNTEIELIIGYNEYSNLKSIEYLKKLNAKLINTNNEFDLYRNCITKYICLYNIYVILQTNWLTELIYYYENIKNSGVISICGNFKDVNYSALCTTDIESFERVFIPINNIVSELSVLFFENESSLLDNTLSLKYYQLKIYKKSMNNYYIPSQTCIYINN